MNTMSKGIVAAAVLITAGVVVAVLSRKKKDEVLESFNASELEEVLGPDRYYRPPVEQAKVVPFTEVAPNKSAYDPEFYEEEDEEEEVEKLRKGIDPNSLEALESYVNMKTSGFLLNSKEDRVIGKLFELPFRPANQADHVPYDGILYERKEFFGENSKWARTATWGDLVLYYAQRIAYNLDDSMEHWAAYLIDQLDITPESPKYEVDAILEDVRHHEYVNKTSGLIGLFGLDDAGRAFMDTQLAYTIHKTITFEFELNAFLNMTMDDEDDVDE